MSELQTNLNVDPYYDDYDSTKGYVRVIFRHSTAVQARELTQIASILQDQVTRFADHIFKDGSIVSGCAIVHHPQQDYIHLKNSFIANTSLAISTIANNYVLVSNTGVRAVPKVVVTGFESQYPNTNIVYLDYIRTGKDGSNNDVTTFANNETITVYDSNQDKFGTLDANNVVDTINTISSNTATGVAYALTISEGIVYQKGHFVIVTPQTVIVKPHDTDVDDYLVGFRTDEEIVTEIDDDSLYDNSNGSSNHNAPGAHRLKLTPTLVSIHRDDLSDEDSFLPIVEFDGTQAVIERQDSVYNKLGDAMSKGRMEESGHYVVKPFTVETLENANTSLIDYAVSPGIAYVNGSRVELIGLKKATTDRAITTKESQSQIVTANYGNYVYLNEVSGLFNFDTANTVTIYDAVQTTVTDGEAASAAPSGNSIGTAIARGFEYDSGTKGANTATYRLYLDNIKMDSGKSFSRDAKSIYQQTSVGYAKGDLVLEGSEAVLKDTALNSLLFPIGLSNIKRLTDASGVNDTQYVFRDIVSGTMQSNGFVTFTTNTPYAGGSERINASTGTLSSTGELDFTIALTAAATSANLTGTITASGTTVTGTGTAFDTQLAAGDMIIANSNARKIVSVTNSTSMVISSSLTVTANVFARYWPVGSIVDLSTANGSINVISNTQFSVTTGLGAYGTLASGSQTVYVQYPVLRTQATAITKEAKKDRFVKISTASNTSGPWDLGLVDVYKISAVYVGNTTTGYANTNPSHPEWFTFSTGQTPTVYGHSTLAIKPQYASQINANTRLLVQLDHFLANTSAGIGFFSVDSYPFRDPGDTANSTNIDIGEVARIGSYDARQLIDFRPQHFNTANSATTIADATANPAANTTLNVNASGTYLVQPATNFEADVECYLGRIDLLGITDTGQLTVTQGVPSETPRTPSGTSDVMTIASIKVPAWPTYTTREGEDYRRSDITTSVAIVTNKRYTMRDIGVLDDRIDRLEYISALNLLEQSARDVTVTDDNGLDRFKNGIFANPFNTHALGDVGDHEYRISIDKDHGIARPYIKTHPIDYKFDSDLSGNVTVTGTTISLPFTSENYVSQPYASKVRNCSEAIWKWSGHVSLYPEYDYYRDESRLPAVNVSLDLTQPWEEFVNSPYGAIYGDWRTIGSTASSSDSVSSSTSATGAVTTTTTTATTTTTTTARNVTSFGLSTIENTYNFGEFVKDVSLNPYMRSREVAFIADGLRPNTRVYVFFDDTNVSEYCAPGSLSGLTSFAEGHENEIVTRTAAWGSNLLTSSAGRIIGVFRIPDGEFRCGDRILKIVNVDDLVTDGDAITSYAAARYTASSLSVSTQNITLHTVEPKLTTSATTQTNVVSATTYSTRTSVVQPVQPTGNDASSYDVGGRHSGADDPDPIAQSFLTVAPPEVAGIFIDRIGVYFKTKDDTLGVTCHIVEMDAGVPDTSRVIASKHLDSANVSTSNTAASETIFDFDGLPYLASNRFYAFMIKADGNSPDYTIWCSEIGTTDVASGTQIFSNPYVGVLFSSANMGTWTAQQNEDLKFNVYRCRFSTTSANVVFTNENDDFFTINGITRANTDVSPQVGDYVFTQAANGTLLTSNTDPSGRLQLLNEVDNILIIDSSTGDFASSDVLEIHREFNANSVSFNANTLIANCTIMSVNNIPYSAIVPRFATLTPVQTSIIAYHKGIDVSYNEDSAAYEVQLETETEKTDEVRYIASYSNEISLGGANKSSKIYLTLSTDSDFVSPVIDLRRKASLVVENIINNDSTGEDTRNGLALSKYVSPQIILDEGQDAEDLNVYVTAYRPFGTDVLVYGKFLNSEDPDEFKSKVWTKLTNSSDSLYSSTLDPNDYREFKFTVPTSAPVTNAANLNGNNIITYTSPTGSTYLSYKSFAVKIVLLSEDIALVPTLQDFFGIALQS